MERFTVGEIELACESFGGADDPPIVLIHGLATQMVGWPTGFCAALVGHGLRVVRFDNRDIGLSTHLHDAAPADVMAALAGDISSAAYTLSDMAADTVGLLDALELESAHIVGASMGGMIAQTIAIEQPGRVRTLTSMMSSTGSRDVGQPTPAAIARLLAPPAQNREEAMQRRVDSYRVIGSPGFPFDEADVRARAALEYDRAYDPPGVARQLLAVVASGDRTQTLSTVRAPTLVIHGAQDQLADVSGGRATAAAIPDAELLVIDGMGHDLPRELWPQITARIAGLAKSEEERRLMV